TVQSTAGPPFLAGVIAVVTILDRLGAGMTVEAVALSFPRGDKERLGIAGTDPHVDDAGPLIDGQDVFPRLSAVGGLVEAALPAWPVEPAQGPDVDDVRIGRMDGDAADLVTLLEAHVLPGLAAINRLVDAIAVGHRVARVVLTCADPDDVLVG